MFFKRKSPNRWEGKTAKYWYDKCKEIEHWWFESDQQNDRLTDELKQQIKDLETEIKDLRAEYLAFQRDAMLVKAAKNT